MKSRDKTKRREEELPFRQNGRESERDRKWAKKCINSYSQQYLLIKPNLYSGQYFISTLKQIFLLHIRSIFFLLFGSLAYILFSYFVVLFFFVRLGAVDTAGLQPSMVVFISRSVMGFLGFSDGTFIPLRLSLPFCRSLSVDWDTMVRQVRYRIYIFMKYLSFFPSYHSLILVFR